MSEPVNSSSPTSDDDGDHTPPRRNVRGKGKGGAGAKYCTMGPLKRKEQFPDHPLSVTKNDMGIEVLWCNACGCPVSHMAKSCAQGHLDSNKHQAAAKRMKKRDKVQARRRLAAEEAPEDDIAAAQLTVCSCFVQ